MIELIISKNLYIQRVIMDVIVGDSLLYIISLNILEVILSLESFTFSGRC